MFYRAVSALLPYVPQGLLARFAKRYIAGEGQDEALSCVRRLARHGWRHTVDLLGENVGDEAAVDAVCADYHKLVDGLAGTELPTSQVSVKPTLMGLRIGEQFAFERFDALVGYAAERGLTVCIDMEDSTTTDATLRLFRRLHERHANLGMALQAYLKRSPEDLRSLLPLRPTLRICKGIYRESEDIAFRDRRRIREAYIALLRTLIDSGGTAAVATHDPKLIQQALPLVRDDARHEFQMLLGVGGSLRARITDAGIALRVYCPFGADWRDYTLRRIRENPDMVGYVFKNLFSPPHRGER